MFVFFILNQKNFAMYHKYVQRYKVVQTTKKHKWFKVQTIVIVVCNFVILTVDRKLNREAKEKNTYTYPHKTKRDSNIRESIEHRQHAHAK